MKLLLYTSAVPGACEAPHISEGCLVIDLTQPENGSRFLRWVIYCTKGRKEGVK